VPEPTSGLLMLLAATARCRRLHGAS
jgi:hypothetical protein